MISEIWVWCFCFLPMLRGESSRELYAMSELLMAPGSGQDFKEEGEKQVPKVLHSPPTPQPIHS